MSDALPRLFGGNPGEHVPEVDPEDVKNFWQTARDLEASHVGRSGQPVGIDVGFMAAICKPGTNVEAVWYRSSMIWMLNQTAQEQLTPWVKDEQVSDAVFQTMATIPMEWVGVGRAREVLPFDVEEFFRRIAKH
jgi:hypothetical protein